MSVVINTNTSATIAANNLSVSNKMLQKSLNRLSSGSKIVTAADDAGGVAVASRLSAASARTAGAIGNIGSALSYLQQQDSALKTGSKIMQRMNELQVLFRDETKSDDDKAQYTIEFDQLKSQYVTAVRQAKFNEISMLSASGDLLVTVNEQLGTYRLSDLSSKVSDTSSWSIDDNFAKAQGSAVVDDLGAAGTISITVGSEDEVLVSLIATDTMSEVVAKINASAVKATASLDSNGSLIITSEVAGVDITVGDDTGTLAAAVLNIAATPFEAEAGSVNRTADELQLLAEARALNGADQNVLGYYTELAAATKINFEAAVSRIMDVDVAEESTQLARWNTLVQAGTAMMAQANGSTLSALSLLKG